jgi:hypothetical protein
MVDNSVNCFFPEEERSIHLTHECKKNFLSYSLQWWAFNFCVAITFLTINLCNCLHHLLLPDIQVKILVMLSSLLLPQTARGYFTNTSG